MRVSTEEQRLGPEAQRASIEAWALRQGVQVASWHVDQGVGGAVPLEQRAALLAALSELRERRAGVLVVAKRDRLARDVVLAAMIERLAAREGARVVAADGTGDGDGPEAMLMRRIVDAFAEYERALIRARTRSALGAKRARGELTGEAPFGKRVGQDGVRLEDNPAEQEIIAIVRCLSDEGMSQRAIVVELAARGVVSREGRPLQQTQVCRMLVRLRPDPVVAAEPPPRRPA